ncbi:MAG: orotate phosphoribosyltransferase [Bacteroidales bacterium]
MHIQQSFADEVAGHLLQINAIKLNVEQPFTWSSGLLAPVYCDNRRILSFPGIRRMVAENLADIIRSRFPGVELIAGVATGAIAHGVLVAEHLDLPFVYVRSTPKAHGLGSQVEGYAPPGSRTVLVEDLISTGKSSMAAFNALKELGMQMMGMCAIFTYDLDMACENLKETENSLYVLSNFETLLKTAEERGLISAEEKHELTAWRDDPLAWSNARS